MNLQTLAKIRLLAVRLRAIAPATGEVAQLAALAEEIEREVEASMAEGKKP